MPRTRTRTLASATVVTLTALVAGGCANPDRMDRAPASSPNASPTVSSAVVPEPGTASGFLTQATQGSVLEVNASRLAQTRSTNPAVRHFAAQMIDEHTATNQEIVGLANSRGIPVPALPTPGQRAVIERLARLSGADFDREYAQAVGIEAHERTVALFRDATRSVRDTDVRTFAQRTLPRLEQHLDAARQLRQTLASAR